MRGQVNRSSRVVALLCAATCAVACELNPQPETPVIPNGPSGPVAATGGEAGMGGMGGSQTASAAGMESDPNAYPEVGGGGSGNDLGVGGLPTSQPGDRDADAGANFFGDSGTFDATPSAVTP